MTTGTRQRLSMGSSYEQRASGLYVPDEYATPPQRPIAVELFAGAGGMSLGFHQAGWHVAAAVEYDLDAACTYLANLGDPSTVVHIDPAVLPSARSKERRWAHELLEAHGSEPDHRGWRSVRAAEWWPHAGTGWISHRGQPDEPQPNEYLTEINRHPPADEPHVEHFWIVDVRRLHGKDILEALELESDDIGCVTGGPPCQGYSMAGKRDVMDPRNSLVFDFARLVVEIQPQTMVMENVPGIVNMRTPEGVLVIDQMALMLSKGGMGTTKALKETLLATSGAGAAVRNISKADADRELGEQSLQQELTQESLFHL